MKLYLNDCCYIQYSTIFACWIFVVFSLDLHKFCINSAYDKPHHKPVSVNSYTMKFNITVYSVYHVWPQQSQGLKATDPSCKLFPR